MSKKKKEVPVSYEIDYRHHDQMLSKFMNMLMWQGKKSISRSIVYHALDFLKAKVDEKPLKVFHKAINNIKPELEVKPRRVGGATYQVPVEVSQKRQLTLAMRWLIKSSRARAGKSMGEKLGAELLDAYNSTGSAFKKREETHKTAESNKAFSHYRW